MMEYDLPLISVITIVYNGERFIADCLNGIRTQTYPNIEYLVIDGGSSDNTINIIRENMDIVDVFVSEQDRGISDAFNKGIFKASGDIIGIINADDYYEPGAVQRVVDVFKVNSFQNGVYYGGYTIF